MVYMPLQKSRIQPARPWLWIVGCLLLVRISSAGTVASEGARAEIKITRELGRATITFTGVLEFSEDPGGPWTEFPGAVSPLVQEVTHFTRFFRARADAPASFFSSPSVAELGVTGPLQQHFDLAFAGLPDGIFPPVREKPYFDGKIHVGGRELPATMRVRGNSSLQECPFPKLKFKVSKEVRLGTPFHDAREVKIGTHCADGGHGNVGRLRDERAAFREALAYEAMQLLGFLSPRVRRAAITYHDTSLVDEQGLAGWELTRQAVVLEDIEVVADRLGGRPLTDDEVAKLTQAGFSEQLVTDLMLFQALLGNWDYTLSPGGEEIWNFDVIKLADGRLIPVAGDFDLASFVTGEVRLSAPWDYRPDLPELERQAHFEVGRIRAWAGDKRFALSRERFRSVRTELETHVAAAEVDEAGRENVLKHLTAFFEAIDGASK